MKVSELIKELEKIDPNAKVYLTDHKGANLGSNIKILDYGGIVTIKNNDFIMPNFENIDNCLYALKKEVDQIDYISDVLKSICIKKVWVKDNNNES